MLEMEERVFQQPCDMEFSSIRELPDTHAWPSIGDEPTVASTGSDEVPVIDLSSSDTVAFGAACESWGAFLLLGHGLPQRLLDSLDSQIRRLFSLPTDQKLLAARSPGEVSGYGLARISSFLPKMLWSEGFTLTGSPLPLAYKLFPGDHPSKFCDVLLEYREAMEALTGKLLKIMLKSLGLEEEDVEWAKPRSEFPGVVQLNSYPSCPDPDHAIGLAAHTDSSLLTILHQSSTFGGLQLLRRSDGERPARWVTVPPLRGALVVNVGDLAHIASNGRLHSVVHRAIVSRTSARFSCAYFCGPPPQGIVAPASKLGRPAYRAVMWKQYLELKGELFDKALNAIKVPDKEEEEEGEEETSSSSSSSLDRDHKSAASIIPSCA